MKEDNPISRRKFFRRVAKLLPVLLIVSSETAFARKLIGSSNSGCEDICSSSCRNYCNEACERSCKYVCNYNCVAECKMGCVQNCMYTCNGTCERSCSGSAKATNTNDTIIISNDSIK